jgi:hypothetical protein
MYQSTVICTGLSNEEAWEAVAGMLTEFAQRLWQQVVPCEWRDDVLRLSAENDADSTGMALLDEFGDAICAYINYSGEIHVSVESILEV